jgi:hypothetical protein
MFKFIFGYTNVRKSNPSIRKIELAMWETLSKAPYVDASLAWGEQDGDSEDEVFHTPIGSCKKEDTNFTTLPRPKTHLEINSHIYFAILKEFIELNVASKSQNSRGVKTKSKCKVSD